MSELRRHYFLNEYVIINDANHKKPSDFAADDASMIGSFECPFCPGNEQTNPTNTYSRFNINNEWQIRSFNNLFPFMDGQEVIAETPDHDRSPADFTDDEITNLMEAYVNRVTYHMKTSKYVALFKNYGKAAGCSLSHSHSQIVPVPIVPPKIRDELDILANNDHCEYCDIVNLESNNIRIIIENDNWIVFTPYCSTSPYEMWMIPKQHISNITEVDDLRLMGITIRDALLKLKILLNNPAYNIVFNQTESGYHFNIRIIPRFNDFAGFEMSTGIIICNKSPEIAAKELRNIKEL